MASENQDAERNAAVQLRLVGKALWCSFFFSAIVLALWFGGLVYEGDRIYQIHTAWFEMSRTQFDLIHYCGLAVLKLTAMMLFLFPAIGIWLVTRNK